MDAPVPRRGRPARDPRPPEPHALSAVGIDVEDLAWSADGKSIAVMAMRGPDNAVGEIHTIDVETGDERRVAGGGEEYASGPRPMPDGGWLYATDASGWFQVVRSSADGRERLVLTTGEREHGDPTGSPGFAAVPSPDGGRFLHIDVHDGLVDLVVAPAGGATPAKRGRGRPPKNPPAVVAATAGRVVSPGRGSGGLSAGLSDGAWHRRDRGERDDAAGPVAPPVPGVAPDEPDPDR